MQQAITTKIKVDGIIYSKTITTANISGNKNYVQWEMQNRSDILSQNFTTRQM